MRRSFWSNRWKALRAASCSTFFRRFRDRQLKAMFHGKDLTATFIDGTYGWQAHIQCQLETYISPWSIRTRTDHQFNLRHIAVIKMPKQLWAQQICGIFRRDRCRTSRVGFDCSLSRCCSCYGLPRNEDRQHYIHHPRLYIGQACCDLTDHRLTFFERITSQHQAFHHATLHSCIFANVSCFKRSWPLSRRHSSSPFPDRRCWKTKAYLTQPPSDAT